MNTERFIVMLEWCDSIEHLNNEEKGILFSNFINYHKGVEVDTSNRIVNSIWSLIKPNIDRTNQAYQKNIENGKKGGTPKGTEPWNKGKKQPKTTESEPKANRERTQSEPTTNPKRTYKEKEKEKEKYKEIEIDNENEMLVLGGSNTNTGAIGKLDDNFSSTKSIIEELLMKTEDELISDYQSLSGCSREQAINNLKQQNKL